MNCRYGSGSAGSGAAGNGAFEKVGLESRSISPWLVRELARFAVPVDAELFGEMIGFAAEQLMELEVAHLTGASYGEKSAEPEHHHQGRGQVGPWHQHQRYLFPHRLLRRARSRCQGVQQLDHSSKQFGWRITPPRICGGRYDLGGNQNGEA
jgi:hypothetical protein